MFASFEAIPTAFSLGAPPRIDADGNVVFAAALAGPSVVGFLETGSNALALYAADGVQLRQVVRLGDPVPGQPGEVFTELGNALGVTAPPEIHAGRVGFQGHGMLWSETASGLLPVDLEGPFGGAPPGQPVVPAPLAGVTGQVVHGELEDDGSTLVRLASGDPVGSQAQWMVRSTPAGPPQAVLGTGFPAPFVGGDAVVGAILGCVFGPPFQDLATCQTTNDFLLVTSLSGPAIDCMNDEVLYRFQGDAPVLVAREGQPAPGIGGGTPAVFGSGNGLNSFTGTGYTVRANGAGHLAFGAIVRGGLADARGEVLYTDRSGTLEPVVRADDLCASGGTPGTPVPGLPPGFTFSRILGGDFNAASQVAFHAIVGDSTLAEVPACLGSVRGLFTDAPGALTTLALAGQPAPGFGPGVVFRDFGTPRLAPADVVFTTLRIQGPGVTLATDLLLVAFDLDGTMRVLLREGQPLDLAGGGAPPLELDHFSLGEGLGALGEVPVVLHFEGGATALGVQRVTTDTLLADTAELSTAAVDAVGFDLVAGAAFAGRSYVLLATLSGTQPGVSLPGGVLLPLNPDAATQLVLASTGTESFEGFAGVLDGLGRAQATFTTPGPLGPAAVGLEADFAYLTLAPFDLASNAVRVVFAP